MSNNNSSIRNRKRNNRYGGGAQDAVLDLLKRIQLNTAQELDRMVPRFPDVQRLRLKRDKVYTFEQAYTVADLSGSTTAPVGGAFSPTFGSINDTTAFSMIFDSYRINQVTISFTPVQSAAPSGGTAPGAMYTAIDTDDSIAPTSVNDMIGYETLLVVPSGTYFERTFTPRVATALYGGSAFTSYGVAQSAWIDCASPTVPHYGLKWLINTSTQTARQWTVIVSVNISFRNQH